MSINYVGRWLAKSDPKKVLEAIEAGTHIGDFINQGAVREDVRYWFYDNFELKLLNSGREYRTRETNGKISAGFYQFIDHEKGIPLQLVIEDKIDKNQVAEALSEVPGGIELSGKNQLRRVIGKDQLRDTVKATGNETRNRYVFHKGRPEMELVLRRV